MKNTTTFTVALLLASATAAAQNGALDLLGTSGYVTVPHSAALVPATGLTVEAWCRWATTSSGGESHVLRKNPQGFNESYDLRRRFGNLEFVIKTNLTGQILNSVPLPQGPWHHIAATHDAGVAKVYLGGMLVQQLNVAGVLADTGGALYLGSGQGDAFTHWDGQIDEIRIWRRARTQSEIQATMNQSISWHPDLVAAWHFDGSLLDAAGGHHGTAVGTIAYLPSGVALAVPLTAPAVVSIGSSLVYQLAGQTPGALYAFDVSTTGTTPGIPLGASTIPLNPPLWGRSFAGLLPGTFTNFNGVVDAAGQGFAALNVPLLPQLVGAGIDGAFIVYTASGSPALLAVSPPAHSTVIGPGPAIAAIQPGTGPAAGGTPVTISGALFQAGAMVRFNGVPATNVVVQDAQTITCSSPAGALGPAVVSVTNPDGGSGSQATQFAYVPTLSIASVQPLVAPPGTIVRVAGANFHPSLELLVAGAPVVPLGVTPAEVSFQAPAGLPCGTTVRVTNPDQQSVAAAFNPAPVINSVGPPYGPASGGSSFFILGSQFHAGTTVTIGGNAATILQSTPLVLLVAAPPGTPGLAPLVVSSSTGCSAQSSYLYQ